MYLESSRSMDGRMRDGGRRDGMDGWMQMDDPSVHTRRNTMAGCRRVGHRGFPVPRPRLRLRHWMCFSALSRARIAAGVSQCQGRAGARARACVSRRGAGQGQMDGVRVGGTAGGGIDVWMVVCRIGVVFGVCFTLLTLLYYTTGGCRGGFCLNWGPGQCVSVSVSVSVSL